MTNIIISLPCFAKHPAAVTSCRGNPKLGQGKGGDRHRPGLLAVEWLVDSSMVLHRYYSVLLPKFLLLANIGNDVRGASRPY